MCTLFVEPRANGWALGNVGTRRAALLVGKTGSSNAARRVPTSTNDELS